MRPGGLAMAVGGIIAETVNPSCNFSLVFGGVNLSHGVRFEDMLRVTTVHECIGGMGSKMTDLVFKAKVCTKEAVRNIRELLNGAFDN